MAELPVELPSFLDLDEAFMPSDAAVVLTDSQGLCEAQNTKAAQLLGGALPHGLSLLQLVQPQTSSNKLARLLEEACSQGTPTPRQRIMLTSPDGAQQPCSVIIHGLARQTPGQGSALWLLEPGWESSAILSATFHAIMDASSDILMFASPDLRITHMNKACMDFFTQREVRLAAAMPGFATDKLIGSSIDTFHRNPDHPRRILQDLARRSRHEQGAFHHSHIEIAGFIFKQTIRPVHIAGELMGYSVAWCDLTTERLQENMLETLLDSSEHGMVVIDATGAVLKANAPARALLGDQTDWRTLLGEASSELFRALEQAAISSSFETWAKTSANQTVFLRCRVKRLPKHPDEPAARFAMTLTDLTDIKEQESQLQELLAAQQQAIAAISTSLAALAQGDLSHEPPQDLQGELAALADHLGALIVVLRFVVGRIQQAITQIRGGLGDLVSGNKSLDARTQQQAASIQEISTALEELSDAVARNAEHAASTAAKAAAMRHHAAEGSKVIDAAAQNMAAIAQTSEAIVEIIAVVDEIAFTTNILALNAAVEAARAGEHGRGFAVVAAEVRRLAQSSASHAKHIKQLIAKSTSLIQEGRALSTQGAEAFAAILEGIGEVSARVAEIAEVTSSQGQASAQLTEAITAVSRATQENSALVEESSAACASLADQAEQLEKMLTEVFRVG